MTLTWSFAQCDGHWIPGLVDRRPGGCNGPYGDVCSVCDARVPDEHTVVVSSPDAQGEIFAGHVCGPYCIPAFIAAAESRAVHSLSRNAGVANDGT